MMNSNPVEVLLGQFVQMNTVIWNCRGALNPNFKIRIYEMAVNHSPAIMVIMEIRVGGDGDERIIADLPFDGCITTETIGYVGGLWALWKKDKADIDLLAATK